MRNRRTMTWAESLLTELAAGQERARQTRVAATKRRRERFAVGDPVRSTDWNGTVHGTVEHIFGAPGTSQQIMVRYARSGALGDPELAVRWDHTTIGGWVRSVFR